MHRMNWLLIRPCKSRKEDKGLRIGAQSERGFGYVDSGDSRVDDHKSTRGKGEISTETAKGGVDVNESSVTTAASAFEKAEQDSNTPNDHIPEASPLELTFDQPVSKNYTVDVEAHSGTEISSSASVPIAEQADVESELVATLDSAPSDEEPKAQRVDAETTLETSSKKSLHNDESPLKGGHVEVTLESTSNGPDLCFEERGPGCTKLDGRTQIAETVVDSQEKSDECASGNPKATHDEMLATMKNDSATEKKAKVSREGSMSVPEAMRRSTRTSGLQDSGDTFASGDHFGNSAQVSEDELDADDFDDEVELDDEDPVEEDDDTGRVDDPINKRGPASNKKFPGNCTYQESLPSDASSRKEPEESKPTKQVNLHRDGHGPLRWSSDSTVEIDASSVTTFAKSEAVQSVSAKLREYKDAQDKSKRTLGHRPRTCRVNSDLSDPDGPDTDSMFDFIRKQGLKQAAFEKDATFSHDFKPSLPARNASLLEIPIEAEHETPKSGSDTLPVKPSRSASICHNPYNP